MGIAFDGDWIRPAIVAGAQKAVEDKTLLFVVGVIRNGEDLEGDGVVISGRSGHTVATNFIPIEEACRGEGSLKVVQMVIRTQGDKFVRFARGEGKALVVFTARLAIVIGLGVFGRASQWAASFGNLLYGQ